MDFRPLPFGGAVGGLLRKVVIGFLHDEGEC
jgi:hypothetical protein